MSGSSYIGGRQAPALRVMGNHREYYSLNEVETTQYINHPKSANILLPVHRRSMRLPEVNYASRECLCFATFNLHSQCKIRLQNEIATTAWLALNVEIEKTGCFVYSLCLMPDHVHLLMSPSGAGETISDLIRRFKSVMYQSIRNEHGLHIKWQSSFYDYVVRDGNSRAREMELISAYIFSNPERAGLHEDYLFRHRS